MIRARKRAIGNAVTIHIAITLEASKPLQVLHRKDLAAIEFLGGILERIRHPIVHAQIEITHHENGCLEAFRKIESDVRHFETLFNARRDQHHVFGVAMRAIDHR